MNKTLDERVLPQGEYIDALNIRMGSTEQSEVGVVENPTGNTALTALQFEGVPLSDQAKTIGSITDGEREVVYWCVHDPAFPVSAAAPLGKIDMIVSFSEATNILTYHVVSVNYDNTNTSLNFNPQYLITGMDIIDQLIFLTDDYNQPRFFNTNQKYALPSGGLDDPLLWEALLVIKRPPAESPDVELTIINGQENYLEDRFVCFAYRYQYENGEYSAISQFSAPAFFPQSFDVTNDAFLNEGMVNQLNAAIVTVNTGGALVKSMDLLFKDMNSNVIKVIEKINKLELALSDNANYSVTFSNSKIFTILPESELLRLYDNVPLRAKAQTIMGNRLMYGNYEEGYDLIDKNGGNTMLGYFLQGVSEEIGISSYDAEPAVGTYTINGTQTVNDSILDIDLTGASLQQGGLLSIDFTFNHAAFSGGTSPSSTTSNITLSLFFELPRDYNSVFEMVTSVEFQDRVGTTLNIQPVSGAPCDGTTFTDLFNCSIPTQLNNYTKTASGIYALGYPVGIIASSGSSIFSIQLLAMQFIDSVASPAVTVYEYYKFVNSEITFQQRGNTKSLHSNRDYEVGIVYMDDFGRSTTALVSPRNTVHFPCSTSDLQNSIQVTIPVTQVAPAWAKRYKFVIKPDKAGYETIYSDIYFQEASTNSVYLLLEGENARKVEVGDRYIVKADATGPKNTCSYATVLEKESKGAGFLGFTEAPAGVYMKMNANDFSVSNDANSKILPGYLSADGSTYPDGPTAQVNYPMNLFDSGSSAYVDYSVPEGTIIIISLRANRPGTGNGTGSCEKRGWSFDQTFTSPANYDNMYDWFFGENIFLTIQTAANASAFSGNGPKPSITYDSSLNTYASPLPGGLLFPLRFEDDFLTFVRDTTNNRLSLQVTGTTSCSGIFRQGRIANIAVDIRVYRATSTLIFETLPSDALPDVFYENELSLPIGPNGEHLGNIQDQSFGPFPPAVPAIVDTGFFNCYTFGNGAESYKIRDSIIGRTLEMGNRVTSVAAQDYQKIDRFSDITYSGIYNNESNVNKLNEFNLGLINYKHCESSFGPIYILDGRQTDVLTLQEDKISYVLAGKNLLSDAAAGGAVTSVPEVLGTQIARPEKYGISFNPESYVHWGQDRYFTDAKRGAVIQIKGDSYANDQIKAISEDGMRTWFRDLFKDSFQTQKLGAFDPYMKEYVLSSNDIKVPQPAVCINCGVNQTITFEASGTESFCVNEGLAVGNITITYAPYGGSPNDFAINATFNGNTYSTGFVTGAGTLVIPKDVNNVQAVQIDVIASDALIIDVNVACVEPIPLTIIEVVITNDYESGKTIHSEYRYSIGTYNSPLQSSFLTFGSDPSNFVISRYNSNTGNVGTGAFPQEGSTVYIISNQWASDTFVFDPTSDKFKYLMSNTLYGNNVADITTLLSLASVAPPNITTPSYNDAAFTVPPLQQYLYLISDFRDSVESSLCFGSSSLDVCCNCDSCADSNCKSFLISNAQAPFVEVEYVECGQLTPTTITVPPSNSVVICINKDFPIPTIISGVADISVYKECGC